MRYECVGFRLEEQVKQVPVVEIVDAGPIVTRNGGPVLPELQKVNRRRKSQRRGHPEGENFRVSKDSLEFDKMIGAEDKSAVAPAKAQVKLME